MIPANIESFRAVVILDTEYVAEAGEQFDPVALGFQVHGSKDVQVYRRENILQWRELPFSIDKDTLLVCYNAAAESGFLHVLGLGMPTMWLDLMAESRVLRNVCLPRRMLKGFEKRHPEIVAPNRDISLLKTAELFGVEGGDADYKDMTRELVLSRKWESGEPEAWKEILDYCASDVRLTSRLFAKMEPHIDLQPALIRGRYAAEHGIMTARGIPVDTASYHRLQDGYRQVLQGYRPLVDPDGSRLTPKGKISQKWLPTKLKALGAMSTHSLTPGGRPSTKAERLMETAEQYEDAELRQVTEWAELLKIFPEEKGGGLRLSPLGKDGRARYFQFPFATHTGRSLGLGREALMQLPAWMRGLVQPKPGEVLLVADYSAQEIAVAASLSGDLRLRESYERGDPYREVALLSGVLRDDTSTEEARKTRKLFKSLLLGRLYGMSYKTFRQRSGVPQMEAANIWRFFDRTFTRFSHWQAQTIAQAQRRGWIKTRFGWVARVYQATKATTLMNWSVQAAAADVLRVAVLILAEAGFDLLTTCHDSILVSVPEGHEEARGAELVRIMGEAAEIAVGIRIRVDVQTVRPGERLLTADTQPMFDRVMALVTGEEFNPLTNIFKS